MLQAVTLPTSVLSIAEMEKMHRLMEAHYDTIEYDRFAADLMEKDRIILLHNQNNKTISITQH